MILRDITTVLHRAPLAPRLGRAIRGDMPDLLAPDDILQIDGGALFHDPFGDIDT